MPPPMGTTDHPAPSSFARLSSAARSDRTRTIAAPNSQAVNAASAVGKEMDQPRPFHLRLKRVLTNLVSLITPALLLLHLVPVVLEGSGVVQPTRGNLSFHPSRVYYIKQKAIMGRPISVQAKMMHVKLTSRKQEHVVKSKLAHKLNLTSIHARQRK